MGTQSQGTKAVKKKGGVSRWPRGQKHQNSLPEQKGMTLPKGRQLFVKLPLKLLVKLQPQQDSADCQSRGELLHLCAPGRQAEGCGPEKAHAALPMGHNLEQCQLLALQLSKPPALHTCNARSVTAQAEVLGRDRDAGGDGDLGCS